MVLVNPHSDFYRARVELLERLPAPTRLRLKATFVMRSRFTEDCLERSFRDGLRQYVLLGAGLDTFAFRQPSWAAALRIFEVDHPATQRWKRRCLVEAGISVPGNIRFVPIDFEKTTLATALSQAGATSSAGRTASGAIKLNTSSLRAGADRTNLNVCSSAASVRYWLTPSIEKKVALLKSRAFTIPS
jgi:methyltransferase (TIGR00027 family)